jgi:GTP-binding protein EngB required for normal cell division
MDLRDYEQFKFKLADILRIAEQSVPHDDLQRQDAFRELFARLAEDRFNLVVAGRFSRGKTSLMNALLKTDRLPTGVVPITSVITCVGYGSNERVRLEYEGGGPSLDISVEELPNYITEQGNPGNRRHIKAAHIELPAELLRRGFYFIDTPGLGSPIAENSRTTEKFLPEADALLLVSSYDSPLSDDEMRVLSMAARTNRHLFLILNKQDLVTERARADVLSYVKAQMEFVYKEPLPPIFSISVLDALAANHASTRHASSGLPQLETALTAFLLQEKRMIFLVHLCERIGALIASGTQDPQAANLRRRIDKLHACIADAGDATGARERSTRPLLPRTISPDSSARARTCEICLAIADALFDFLRQYQYALSTSPEERNRFAAEGGFCGRHLWQYAALASPRGICVSLAPLLKRRCDALQTFVAQSCTASSPSVIQSTNCRCCALQQKVENERLSALASRLGRQAATRHHSNPALCWRHHELLLQRMNKPELVTRLLSDRIAIMERLSEDMERYALKHDGVRRALTSEEERDAAEQAVLFLAGHRHVDPTSPDNHSSAAEPFV